MKLLQNIIRHHFGKAFVAGAALIVIFSQVAPHGDSNATPNFGVFLLFIFALALMFIGVLGLFQFLGRDRD